MRGKGTKLGEGKGTKLGEGCTKVRLSQDRMTILSPLPKVSWGSPAQRLGCQDRLPI